MWCMDKSGLAVEQIALCIENYVQCFLLCSPPPLLMPLNLRNTRVAVDPPRLSQDARLESSSQRLLFGVACRCCPSVGLTSAFPDPRVGSMLGSPLCVLYCREIARLSWFSKVAFLRVICVSRCGYFCRRIQCGGS